MISDLALIGRNQKLLVADIEENQDELDLIVASSKFLVLGGAGTIGQAVVKEILKDIQRSYM